MRLTEPLEMLTSQLLSAKTDLSYSEMVATSRIKKEAQEAKKEIPKRKKRVQVFEEAIRRLKAK